MSVEPKIVWAAMSDTLAERLGIPHVQMDAHGKPVPAEGANILVAGRFKGDNGAPVWRTWPMVPDSVGPNEVAA